MKRKHISYITFALIAPLTTNYIIGENAFAATFASLNQESKTSTVVAVRDANLLKAINNQLGRGEVLNEVTIADLESLTVLNASRKNIESIDGLEYAVNLTNLDLNYNNISDISKIGRLVKLKNLDLSDNKISDITSLSNLTEVNYLTLDVNRISDISPLKNLNNIVGLDLCNQSLEYSYEFETEDDKMNISVDNPVFGFDKDIIHEVSAISNNGTYDNDKLKWDDVPVGEHRFTYSFARPGLKGNANFNGNVVVNIKIKKIENKPVTLPDDIPAGDADEVVENKPVTLPDDIPAGDANEVVGESVTEKPQTGDSLIIHLVTSGLAIAGLIALRKFDLEK